ncbi:uncharacterized protein PITG_17810 [Phytophthora infestans T30-4]|uniref:Uncharacterized protein n=1 Tax=Phytophthora infestans (strain T30-4) TaxID=403677 RepID=D0NW47_PHYIT|nr:uncharacterized protein PITG_17810 [Phytophthora infestans T30-4]EEY66932.1 hypothetical protein PITG_17810 [Phytophthora infestans T30-4]|eukprot:XP_002896650.1 hypothetical protein PITG_17810 [Phytophthora infestans T30-4]
MLCKYGSDEHGEASRTSSDVDASTEAEDGGVGGAHGASSGKELRELGESNTFKIEMRWRSGGRQRRTQGLSYREEIGHMAEAELDSSGMGECIKNRKPSESFAVCTLLDPYRPSPIADETVEGKHPRS